MRHLLSLGNGVIDMKEKFKLDPEKQYFQSGGVQVTAFSDFYPAGHQSGISVIMHGKRAATNGDVRFEPTPGQWQPVPKQLSREVREDEGSIVTTLSYPDREAHLKGFNPLIYPDFEFTYQVSARAEGDGVLITVDLDREIPEKYIGKLCFLLELYPGELFGKPWLMDEKQGIFPRQPNGPLLVRESNYQNAGHFEGVEEWTSPEILAEENREYSPIVADDILGEPYAEGHCFTARPEDPCSRLTVISEEALIRLYDGRMNHNNGWFVLSSYLPGGKTKEALRWKICPNVAEDWLYEPVVQVSQVGYHPDQKKCAVIETDPRDMARREVSVFRMTAGGPVEVRRGRPKNWGAFLRYKYWQFDFSDIREEGMYRIQFGNSWSAFFRIARDVYDRGVWQPVLEYFLPVQMCHMRVQEKYRLWHGLCHADDARMAPVNRGHFDGYRQGPSTMTKFQPGDAVPGLNVGGWHDAGDYDLRVESQSGECYILALAYEMFGVDYDATTIDQRAHVVEIHQPDGKNDILQQIEHGALSVVGGYRALGRLYRGIICRSLRQYVLQGDAAGMTKGIPGDEDDRLVFTEDNPCRELTTAAHLAAVARVMRGFNDTLAGQALQAAEELLENTALGEDAREPFKTGAAGGDPHCRNAMLQAAAELLLTTGEEKYREILLRNRSAFLEHAGEIGWIAARAADALGDEGFREELKKALVPVKENIYAQSKENPYGIPYRPILYGAGWSIQGMAFRYYFLYRAFPDLFEKDILENALNFVLGCHPGSNTASFASGVGSRSMTTAYGCNRADWSYVPGGVVSGTALIQPDFPELLDFPFLWQQAEYVLGGGSSNYMFLVLAVRQALTENTLQDAEGV